MLKNLLKRDALFSGAKLSIQVGAAKTCQGLAFYFEKGKVLLYINPL